MPKKKSDDSPKCLKWTSKIPKGYKTLAQVRVILGTHRSSAERIAKAKGWKKKMITDNRCAYKVTDKELKAIKELRDAQAPEVHAKDIIADRQGAALKRIDNLLNCAKFYREFNEQPVELR